MNWKHIQKTKNRVYMNLYEPRTLRSDYKYKEDRQYNEPQKCNSIHSTVQDEYIIGPVSLKCLKARLHSKSRHACLRREHLRHAFLGCLHINVFVHVSSISRHLPVTICTQRLRSKNREWWYCCYFVHYNHCKCS